ncbi:hypothetical protein ABPG74_016830 [Tetrahymena malaccensis]
MSKSTFQNTNLNYAIEVQLGIIKPKFSQISNDEKQKYEKEFQEFYENDLKTGFYINRDQDDNNDGEESKDANQTKEENLYVKEIVRFYNYNQNNGWWHYDEKSQKTIFFNSNGNIYQNQDFQMDKFFKLVQQENILKKLEEFYRKYDYVLTMIYSKVQKNDDILQEISKQITKSKKSFVSPITDHQDSTQNDSQYKRISIFISKYDFTDKDQADTKETSFESFKNILKKYENNNNILIFPLIVKEEIKEIIQEDFSEEKEEKDDNGFKIFTYCQQHRYECLYDSDSEDEYRSDSSDDEDEDEDVVEEQNHEEEVVDDDSSQNSDDEDNGASQPNTYVVKE